MEAVNRKKSLVFLLNHPNDVLQFLGHDPGPYHRRFAFEEDLFGSKDDDIKEVDSGVDRHQRR